MTIARYGQLSLLLFCAMGMTSATRFDRRIVDRVIVGDSTSESAHAYAADRDTTGVANGRAYRSTRGWLRYALTVFDDTEVTVSCIFSRAEHDDGSRGFDVIVENQVVASYEYGPSSTLPDTLDIRVPIGLTHGRTNIQVMLRVRRGATPPLRELRTIQDHNE